MWVSVLPSTTPNIIAHIMIIIAYYYLLVTILLNVERKDFYVVAQGARRFYSHLIWLKCFIKNIKQLPLIWKLWHRHCPNFPIILLFARTTDHSHS